MAISKSVLEEPLLSRQQTAVLRDIARAALLNQGLLDLKRISDDGVSYSNQGLKRIPYPELQKYLESEIERVLMQIKVPKQPSGDHGKSNPTQ